eukprot:scaffold83427_cov69-Phaeocystis_antarctica.AAC.1
MCWALAAPIARSSLLAGGPTSDSTTSDAMRSRIWQCGRRRARKPSPNTGIMRDRRRGWPTPSSRMSS